MPQSTQVWELWKRTGSTETCLQEKFWLRQNVFLIVSEAINREERRKVFRPHTQRRSRGQLPLRDVGGIVKESTSSSPNSLSYYWNSLWNKKSLCEIRLWLKRWKNWKFLRLTTLRFSEAGGFFVFWPHCGGLQSNWLLFQSGIIRVDFFFVSIW